MTTKGKRQKPTATRYNLMADPAVLAVADQIAEAQRRSRASVLRLAVERGIRAMAHDLEVTRRALATANGRA